MVDLLLESPPSSAGASLTRVRRLVMVVEYQGTNYHGFQLQQGQPTIQGELEHALLRLTGHETRIRGASRTDSGAHARGQVVDFLTPAPLGEDVFVRGLNYYLPPDIKVQGCCETEFEFHSRKSAHSRIYRYTLLNSPMPSPLMREFSHWIREPLDVPAMDHASRDLLGTHDFAALAGTLPAGRSTIRKIRRWHLWRDDDLVYMEAEGNGFLPHQIRRTGAVLLEVGLGRLGRDVLPSILEGTMPVPAWCASLPAKGLCLMSVQYNDFPRRTEGHEENTNVFSQAN